MQMTLFILKGFIIGLTMAAIVGPITILCVQRTIASGFRMGFLTGLGSSVANCVYALIACLGLADIAHLKLEYEGIIAGIGGILLVYLALNAFRARAQEISTVANPQSSSLQSFTSSFLISLASPLTILLFLSLYTGSMELDYTQPIGNTFVTFLTLGMFIGATAWWVTLSGIIERVRRHITPAVFRNLNRVSGLILLSLACLAFLKFYNMLA